MSQSKSEDIFTRFSKRNKLDDGRQAEGYVKACENICSMAPMEGKSWQWRSEKFRDSGRRFSHVKLFVNGWLNNLRRWMVNHEMGCAERSDDEGRFRRKDEKPKLPQVYPYSRTQK